MSRKKKVLLVIVGMACLLGVCMFLLSIYARKVINKEKFIKPEEIVEAAVEIPAADDEKLAYAQDAFNGAFGEEAVVSKSYSIEVPDDSVKTDMKPEDEAILRHFKNSYVSYAASLYEGYDKVLGSEVEDKRFFEYDMTTIDTTDVIDGTENEDGTVTPDGYYHFSITYPAQGYVTFTESGMKTFDTFGIDENKHIIDDIKAEIAPMAEVIGEHLELVECSSSGRISKDRNKIEDAVLTHKYTVEVTLQFVGDYKELGVAEISFDYIVRENYSFKWYGAYFTGRAMYMNPKDDNQAPLYIYVSEEATKDDYVLEFKSADESRVKINSEGRVEALAVTDDPVEISVKLEYKGKIYEDSCLVTVTDLEIEEASK